MSKTESEISWAETGRRPIISTAVFQSGHYDVDVCVYEYITSAYTEQRVSRYMFSDTRRLVAGPLSVCRPFITNFTTSVNFMAHGPVPYPLPLLLVLLLRLMLMLYWKLLRFLTTASAGTHAAESCVGKQYILSDSTFRAIRYQGCRLAVAALQSCTIPTTESSIRFKYMST